MVRWGTRRVSRLGVGVPHRARARGKQHKGEAAMSGRGWLRACLLATCALALVVSACGRGAGEDGGGAAEGGTLNVGAALSLTGSLSKEGRLTKLGYQFCQDKVNG